MQVFAPNLWSFSKTILNIFKVQNDGVRRHFPGHPFASTTFNLGPVVTTFPHKDMKNLSWGWCAITSFGDYDPKKGGHLVLWDLKVVLEFPPYSTIFIPSAIVMHSNTTVAEGETRYSVTQYTWPYLPPGPPPARGPPPRPRTGGEGAWKLVITCWVHLELMCIFPTM